MSTNKTQNTRGRPAASLAHSSSGMNEGGRESDPSAAVVRQHGSGPNARTLVRGHRGRGGRSRGRINQVGGAGRGGSLGGSPATPLASGTGTITTDRHGGRGISTSGQGPRLGGAVSGAPPFAGGRSRGAQSAGPAEIFATDIPAKVDDRLAGLDTLVDSYKELGVRDVMPLRPGMGMLGTPQLLRANFFAVKTTRRTIYDYSVSILPTPEGGAERRAETKARIFALLEAHPEFSPHVSYIRHDRSQRIVSSKRLPAPLTFEIPYYEEGQAAPGQDAMAFKVDIELERELDMDEMKPYMEGQVERERDDTQPLISAINLILRPQAAQRAYEIGGNRFFFPSATSPLPLSLGVEAWKGFFMSVRPMYKQLMVNVNVCMSAFYVPGNMADAMFAFQERTGGAMPQRFVEKLKVSTTYLGYTKKKAIHRIADLTARKTKFPCAELGGMVTVEEYFQKKYNITLKHPDDLPVVNLGDDAKPVHVPAELCYIYPGQLFGKLDGRETAQMIKYACNPPAFNAAAIRDHGLSNLGLRSEGTNDLLEQFGISVEDSMTVIPSRVLPPPQILYRARSTNVQGGSWNFVKDKFHSGAVVDSWAVLLVHDRGEREFSGKDDPALIPFLNAFAQKCRSGGMTFPSSPTIISTSLPRFDPQDPTRRRAVAEIKQALTAGLNLGNQPKPSFVLVLLSRVDNLIYPGIKHLCDIELGIHTLHMILKTARGRPDDKPQRQDQYFANVALKLNIKLGGINHLVDSQHMSWLTQMSTMVVGIDATHPGPLSAKGSPSIVAVVASIDDQFVQFPASLALQKPDRNKESKEMVSELSRMMLERLQLYQKKNGLLPERVLIFRDGVSEGQYKRVIEEELPQIRDAFRQVSPENSYSPKLTIVICGKRHHARFYPTDSKDATKNGNTLPGTLVEKGVTDVYYFDYYLQAHAGLQGQVRPTHYFVVYDDFHYDADTLQQGTHVASYLYARATKAVSLVPPAYYADLACERARFYVNAVMNLAEPRGKGDEKGKGKAKDKGKGKEKAHDRSEEKDNVFKQAEKMWGSGVHPDLRESMFYI